MPKIMEKLSFKDRLQGVIAEFKKQWRFILCIVLCSVGFKSLLLSAIPFFMLRMEDVTINDIMVELAPDIYYFIALGVISLILMAGAIFLFLRKPWAKTIIISIFPIYYILYVVVIYISKKSFIYSLVFNGLLPPFYIFLIWLFRQKFAVENSKSSI